MPIPDATGRGFGAVRQSALWGAMDNPSVKRSLAGMFCACVVDKKYRAAPRRYPLMHAYLEGGGHVWGRAEWDPDDIAKMDFVYFYLRWTLILGYLTEMNTDTGKYRNPIPEATRGNTIQGIASSSAFRDYTARVLGPPTVNQRVGGVAISEGECSQHDTTMRGFVGVCEWVVKSPSIKSDPLTIFVDDNDRRYFEVAFASGMTNAPMRKMYKSLSALAVAAPSTCDHIPAILGLGSTLPAKLGHEHAAEHTLFRRYYAAVVCTAILSMCDIENEIIGGHQSPTYTHIPRSVVRFYGAEHTIGVPALYGDTGPPRCVTGGEWTRILFSEPEQMALGNFEPWDIAELMGQTRFDMLRGSPHPAGDIVLAASAGGFAGTYEAKPKEVVLPATMHFRIEVLDILLDEGQDMPRLCIWPSRRMASAYQPASCNSDGGLGEMFSNSHSVVTPVVASVASGGSPIDVLFNIDPEMPPTSVKDFLQDALWVSLYVRQKDSQNALPHPARHGSGFIWLSELDAALGGPGLVLSIWEGPIDNSLSIAPSTGEVTSPMRYFKTATLRITPLAPICPTASALSRRKPVSSNKGISADEPRSLFSEEETRVMGKMILALMDRFRSHGEESYHSVVYSGGIPGTLAPLATVVHQATPEYTVNVYAAHLRHRLWEFCLSDAEFMDMYAAAMSPSHPHSEWAHERLLWIVSRFLTPFNAFIYNSDTLRGRGVETMLNIMLTRRGDCEDFSEPEVLFIERLKALGASVYAPLGVVMKLLDFYVPTHATVIAHKGAMSDRGDGGMILHMVEMSVPVTWIFPESTAIPPELRGRIRPFFCEGTGDFMNSLRNPRACFSGAAPEAIIDGIHKYARIQHVVGAEFSKGALSSANIAAPVAGGGEWAEALNHPFYFRVVQFCSRQISTADSYLELVLKNGPPSGPHRFPHVADVVSGRTDLFDIRPSGITSPEVRQLIKRASAHIQPTPASPEVLISISPTAAVQLSKMPAAPVKMAPTSAGMRNTGGLPSWACVKSVSFTINLESRADAMDVGMRAVHDCISSAELKTFVTEVDYKLWNVFGRKETLFVLRVCFV